VGPRAGLDAVAGEKFPVPAVNRTPIVHSHILCACYMSRPSHTPSFDHPDNVW